MPMTVNRLLRNVSQRWGPVSRLFIDLKPTRGDLLILNGFF